MMCWMTIVRGADAAADALAACQDHEQLSGGHSWGVAYAVDGEIRIEKGTGHIPEWVVETIAEAPIALGHTRLATRGIISKENAHPFPIRDEDGETVAALAHNGTWLDAPRGLRCDSYYIARVLETAYRADPDRPFHELVQQTGERIGETVTVLHRDGTGYAYAGRFGITESPDTVASSGGKSIPLGVVHTI